MRRTAQHWLRQVSARARIVTLFVVMFGLSGLATFTWLDSRSPGAAAQASKPRPVLNYDVRLSDRQGLSAMLRTRTAALTSRLQAQRNDLQTGLTRLRAVAPKAEVKLSPLTANVEIVRAPEALSAPAPGLAGPEVVRGFLRSHQTLYGLSNTDLTNLRYLGESVSPGSGLRMVRVEQTVNGRPVFQSETRFMLQADGRVFRSTGLFVSRPSNAPGLSKLISAPAALRSALEPLGIAVNEAVATLGKTNAAGTETEVLANHKHIAGPVASQIVYFPLAPGVLVPAWSQITFTAGEGDYYTLVDATTGQLLWRKNIRSYQSAHDARFRVYVQADGKTPADNPAPKSPTTAVPGAGTQFADIFPTIVNMHTVFNPLASPNGWINDCPAGGCTANETQTLGNNVLACLDRVAPFNVCDTDAGSVLDGNGRPVGNPDTNGRNRDFLGTTPRDFQTNFLPPPQAGNPEAGQTATGEGNNGTLAIDQFRRGAVTQLFYVSNWYHDQLYALGFDEAAGNFQQANFSGMGFGGDRVLADAQDGSGTNNANFSTPPDGISGRMQMYRFTGPALARDGDLDGDVMVHELTHGTSNRLIGNGAGLMWNIGAGLGEGWSDFYALSLLNNTNADDPNGAYTSGAYTTYKYLGLLDNYLYGIRRFPYSTNNTVNPLTWADVDDVTNNLAGGIAPTPITLLNEAGGLEIHNIGEIWALTLWEVRARVIAAHGNDVPTGNQKMLQLVTDAMKLTPINPSFTEARDALLDADCAANACANEQAIWDGFADRGLGYNAVAPLAHMGFSNLGHMSVGESFATPYLDLAATTIDDSLGNNNGAIDPGEPIKLTVTLKNPWRNAAKGAASATASLTALTTGVAVLDGSANYGAVPAQGTASGDVFIFTVPTNAACGQSLKFTVQTTSGLGTTSFPLNLRVGQANGVGAPVTFTRLMPTPLVIPDGRPRGVFDTFSIPEDLEIADLDLRIDSLTHNFTGDLTVMLRAPNGYGGDLIWLREVLFGGGGGANFSNTVIDDESFNDLNQSFAAEAPFTGDWLPAFNSPIWFLFGNPGIVPDAVGQLSRLDGLSTQGNWQLHVADFILGDIGSLNSWSLIVTPRAFACTPFAPTAAVTATKTATGAFTVGGTLTYTITLTNRGTGATPDNAGNELTDVLPPTLQLVSASASAGTAVATVGTNTVTWNGSVPPLGGSVVITITATVLPAAAGSLVANQGALAFDADLNGSNETTGLTDDPGPRGATDPTVVSIPCPAITLSDLPNGKANTPYNVTLSASPASAYTFTQVNGTLPPGLTLAPNGALWGTPTQSGTFTFGMRATLNANATCTGTRGYSLTIACPMTWTPGTLPGAQAGVAYNTQVTATGATSYSLYTGNLPPGLTLNAATGTLTGTATAPGTYSFTLLATAAGGCAGTQPFSLTVSCPTITVNPASLPAGLVGTAYSQALSATPAGNYSYTRTSGSLPPGMNLSAAGVLSGTPTTQGTYTFTVTASAFGSCTGSRTYTLTINGSCAAITLPSLPGTGSVNVNYNGNLAATTPSGSYTFTVDSGALPPGLKIDNLFGLLSGKPTTPNTYVFTLKATRSNGCTGTRTYTVVISGLRTALAQLADYDGDGKADYSLWSAPTGAWQIVRSRTQQPMRTAWGRAGDVALRGDYDGDGLSDLAVFRPGDATFYVQRSSNGTALVKSFGAATDVPVPGDYDGDGKTDLALWRGTTGVWLIQRSSDEQWETKAWGASTAPYLDVPVPADYDGDGKTDFAVFRRQTGTWLMLGSATGQVTVKAWGMSTDVPVPGDYDGDGQADLAVWRGVTGEWFVLRSSDDNYEVTVWGAAWPGDVPVPGDYDGDGRTDLAVWRILESQWYVRQSSDAALRTQVQGGAGERLTPIRQ